MQQLIVLSRDSQPLDPCHPARARELLRRGRAAVWRHAPFTIRLKDRTAAQSVTHLLRMKLDPGSKTTGVAVVNDATGRVAWAAEIEHRGQRVHKALVARRAVRCSRRQRHTRYRQPRFDNRRRRDGWLPPSLESRLANVTTWVGRLRGFFAIGAISMELVRFDTQLLRDPEVSGTAYQQGTLAGYEVREYLLEKFKRACAYCGAQDVPLQVEHVTPRARGGTHRIDNLTLACEPCNTAKGNQTAEEFGHPQVQAQAKAPLRDAAAVNTTRWTLYRRLEANGLPVEVGTGGRTKWNRARRGLPKAHWLDAACVGASGASTPERLLIRGITPLAIRAMGHGDRQVCRTNAAGFPIRHRSRVKRHFGIAQGDLVRALVPQPSKYAGTYLGRVGVRARGSFAVADAHSGRPAQGIHHRHCRVVQHADGYQYRATV